MKRFASILLPLLGLVLLRTALAATDDAVIPSPLPQDRYSAMIARSPFSLATPKAAPEEPSFAANLYVTGLGKQGDIDVVAITSRDPKQSTFTLFGTGDTYRGITLVSVQWSDEVGVSKVTIKKGAKTGSIGFNEQVLKSPISVTPPKPSRNVARPSIRRGSARQPVPLPRPSTTTSTDRTPRPRVRPRRTIRRPGQ